MKKLLLLGGSSYLLPVIEIAHKLDIYVITCDYLPDNTAHAFSDEYWDISIVDEDKVLEKAKENKIDGILSFACDPGVVTAAYVAEKMNLPFQCSYEAACILQDKGRFRQYLTENGFNAPKAKGYSKEDDPMKDIGYFNWPVIVKPTDSAGSKGITKVETPDKLTEAVNTALEASNGGTYIIEDFIEFKGCHSSADLFTIDGKLTMNLFSDHVFDKNAPNSYVPICNIIPSTMSMDDQEYLGSELQRLMELLGVKTGLFNIETCVDVNGIPYIMEVTPRGGGCGIAELQDMAMNAFFVENEIRKAVNMDIVQSECEKIDGYYCELVIHLNNEKPCIYKDISVREDISARNLKKIVMCVQPGDEVLPFTGANRSLGNAYLHCDNREELIELVDHSSEWLDIIVE